MGIGEAVLGPPPEDGSGGVTTVGALWYVSKMKVDKKNPTNRYDRRRMREDRAFS